MSNGLVSEVFHRKCKRPPRRPQVEKRPAENAFISAPRSERVPPYREWCLCAENPPVQLDVTITLSHDLFLLLFRFAHLFGVVHLGPDIGCHSLCPCKLYVHILQNRSDWPVAVMCGCILWRLSCPCIRFTCDEWLRHSGLKAARAEKLLLVIGQDSNRHNDETHHQNPKPRAIAGSRGDILNIIGDTHNCARGCSFNFLRSNCLMLIARSSRLDVGLVAWLAKLLQRRASHSRRSVGTTVVV
mmetsp:Transcript_119948/g.188159  ORF Transcript_119948/g.188159 Transcript_119948/m.188159 type:complete len:243 (-) Transcript_119948:1665-2393(-)